MGTPARPTGGHFHICLTQALQHYYDKKEGGSKVVNQDQDKNTPWSNTRPEDTPHIDLEARRLFITATQHRGDPQQDLKMRDLTEV